MVKVICIEVALLLKHYSGLTPYISSSFNFKHFTTRLTTETSLEKRGERGPDETHKPKMNGNNNNRAPIELWLNDQATPVKFGNRVDAIKWLDACEEIESRIDTCDDAVTQGEVDDETQHWTVWNRHEFMCNHRCTVHKILKDAQARKKSFGDMEPRGWPRGIEEKIQRKYKESKNPMVDILACGVYKIKAWRKTVWPLEFEDVDLGETEETESIVKKES